MTAFRQYQKGRDYPRTAILVELHKNMERDHLYVYNGESIGEEDFVSALKSLGVKNGDTLFVHSAIDKFGKVGPSYDPKVLCGSLVRALKKSVGPKGTLAMPTFTYSYCETRVFDMDKSPSEVGALSEFFRKQRGVIRSQHPIFSIAASGTGARALVKSGTDAFGDDSIFGNVRRQNALLVFLGSTFKSCTLGHHITQMHGVPYRSIKTFSGVIKHGRRSRKVDATYFVRPLDGTIDIDLSRLENRLAEEGLLKKGHLGASTIECARAQDIYNVGMEMLDSDIYALAKRLK